MISFKDIEFSSIRTLLAGIVIASAVIPATVIMMIAISNMADERAEITELLEHNFKQEFTQITHGAKTTINDHFDSQLELLSAYQSDPVIHAVLEVGNRGNRKLALAADERLREHLDHDETKLEIYLVDEHGTVMASSWDHRVGQDHSELDYLQPIQGDHYMVEVLYGDHLEDLNIEEVRALRGHDSEHGLVIIFSDPVHSKVGGHLLGHIILTQEPTILISEIEKINEASETADFYIVDGHGRAIVKARHGNAADPGDFL